MTDKYKILGKYIKDMSSETPDIETYIMVKERILKYQLGIDIKSKALKDKLFEIDITFKFKDKEEIKKRSYFEIVYSVIVKIIDENIKKNELEKIFLCEVPIEIYPDIEKALTNLLNDSGFPGVKFDKAVDFEKLYEKRIN
tara:strand:- start:183 stop:605 length:423 start_codon:yes stop_codon:yes gene_type:complete